MFNLNQLQITAEILNLIASIDEFKGTWQALGTLAPERLSTLRRVASIESIGSSTRIEGAKLSDKQVEALLANLSISTFSSRDEQEMAGYADALNLIYAIWTDIKPTENHIRQLHRDLLQHSQKDAWHRGNYKTTSNSVAAFDTAGQQIGIVFQTASPFNTPSLMSELASWLENSQRESTLHPLIAIAIWVVVFLEIHPFQDGNGRLSRVMTTLLLLKAEYAYVAYSSLETIIEANKEAYYLALRQTQSTIRSDAPNWQPWLEFFLRSLAEQVKRLKIKIEHERIVIATLPTLSLQIIEHTKAHGRITMAEAVRLTGANRNTLKGHFRALVESNRLSVHGAGRGAWYQLR